MAEHTSGPWVIKRARHNSINGARIMSGEVVVARVSHKADKPVSQKKGDARLIAAAPASLAQLVNITGRFERCMIVNGSTPEYAATGVADARAAIAAATGEQDNG